MTSVFVRELGQLGHEPHAQPVRDRDHAACAIRRAARERLGEPAALDVSDVGAVRREHERRAHRSRGARRGRPGEGQEVRVDDVGLEPLRRAPGVAGQAQVLRPPEPAPVDRHHLELVALRLELAADLRDERAEVRVRLARPHLADDEDLHRGQPMRPRAGNSWGETRTPDLTIMSRAL